MCFVFFIQLRTKLSNDLIDRPKIRPSAECSGVRAVPYDKPVICGLPGKKSRDRQPLDLGTMHTCGQFNKRLHIALRSRIATCPGYA